MVLEGASAHGAGGNDLVGGSVAVLGNVELDGVAGGGLGDVVVLPVPEEDDAVGVLL